MLHCLFFIMQRLSISPIPTCVCVHVSQALLAEIERDMEGATLGLRRAASHAEQVRKKKRKFWLYMCIVFELLILFFLVSYGLS